MTAATAAMSWPSEGRAPPAGVDDETLVLLLGVLNLAGLFLYSAYNFVQDRPRLRSTYDRYVDAQVRRVLDDLVMRVHETAYFSDLLETARGAGRGLGAAPPHIDFGRLEALSADFPFPAAPGRQLAWLRRQNVSRAELPALATVLPLVSALRQLPAGLRSWLQELAQPQPALAGHQRRAYAGLVRLASQLHWRQAGALLDGRQLRLFKTKWRKKPLTAKQEAALRRKALLEPLEEPQRQQADEQSPVTEPEELWAGSHWTDRWYELASQVTPVLLDAGNGYALSRRRPHCLPAVVCQLNRDWKPHGAIKASLSPLASLLLGWWLQDLGAGVTLEDTLVAVRAGWLQRSCSELYPRCHAVRRAEPPLPLPPPSSPLPTSTEVTLTTTGAPPSTKTTTPHGFLWALSSLLKPPATRPKKPVQPPPSPPPSPLPTTALPPVIVGRVPPSPDTRDTFPAADGESAPAPVAEVDWGGAPPVEPPAERRRPPPPLAPGWDRNQAAAWNTVDPGGSGGPPWDQFGGHGGAPPRGRPREVTDGQLSLQRPDERPERPPPDLAPERRPEHQPAEQWLDQPDQTSGYRPDQTLDYRPDHRPDLPTDRRPLQQTNLRPDRPPNPDVDQRLDLRPDLGPDQRLDHIPDQQPDQSVDSSSAVETAAGSRDPYRGGHLIPGSLASGAGALLALRRRRPGPPYRPSRRGYVAEYGQDVLSGVQQSYAAGGVAAAAAAGGEPTTFRPGLVLDAPPPAAEQSVQLLPGRYRLGLRRGLPSGGVQGVLPAYAERRRGLPLPPPPPPPPSPRTPATSPAPRHSWVAPTAPPAAERRRNWVQFGPQDGVTDKEKHMSLYSYVRDRSVRRLWPRSRHPQDSG